MRLARLIAAAVNGLLAQPACARHAVRYPLWPDGVPGFKHRPEESAEYWTKHINNPSVTAFLPYKAKANGTEVVIVPGGRQRIIPIASEGNDGARCYTERGAAAFIVRYRPFREQGSRCSLEDARAHTERVVRLARPRAAVCSGDPPPV